jgi:protein tyrosine phosphatase
MAKCPAHQDNSPSLSISEGYDGRVLVHCFAGCTHTAVLAALGLRSSDLFPGLPPFREQTAAIQAARSTNEQRSREIRKARRQACDQVRKWEAIVNVLGGKLTRVPENDALAAAFDEACDRLHDAEIQADERN